MGHKISISFACLGNNPDIARIMKNRNTYCIFAEIKGKKRKLYQKN